MELLEDGFCTISRSLWLVENVFTKENAGTLLAQLANHGHNINPFFLICRFSLNQCRSDQSTLYIDEKAGEVNSKDIIFYVHAMIYYQKA